MILESSVLSHTIFPSLEVRKNPPILQLTVILHIFVEVLQAVLADIQARLHGFTTHLQNPCEQLLTLWEHGLDGGYLVASGLDV
jgi:hypothetical protein